MIVVGTAPFMRVMLLRLVVTCRWLAAGERARLGAEPPLIIGKNP
jgi:hypothetical protein